MGDKSNKQKLAVCAIRSLGLLSTLEGCFQLHPVLCGIAIAEYRHGKSKYAYGEPR